jgi:aspartyl/glutamyl-tRNA(Asn/Gln) amidotransferase C subunit
MSFTEQDLDTLSKLSRIDIKEEEKAKMLADMQAILGYVSEINTIEGSTVSYGGDIQNVVRDDVITHMTSSNTDAILSNAPKIKDGYVEVEQVLK